MDGADRHLRRRRLGLLAALIVAAPSAYADDYPFAITDRPILLPSGVTELDFSLGATTLFDHGMAGRTFGFSNQQLDVRHAFGDLELEIGTPSVGARWNTHSALGVLTANAAFAPRAIQINDSYYYSQGFGIGQKWLLTPQRFAIFAGAGVGLDEVDRNSFGHTTPGHVTSVSAEVTAEMQVQTRLGMYVSLTASSPVDKSSNLDAASLIRASTTLLLAFRRWDLTGELDLAETRESLLPAFLFGVSHRWGL